MTHPDAREGERAQPLDLSKFRNIAGRAGHAGKETEGLILFLDPGRENKKIGLTNDFKSSTTNILFTKVILQSKVDF